MRRFTLMTLRQIKQKGIYEGTVDRILLKETF